MDTALGIRDRALLELLYASGLRVSEALGLDLTDLSTAEESVRVVGKGDRERVVPVGDVALAALDRYVHDVRPAWLARHRRRHAATASRSGRVARRRAGAARCSCHSVACAWAGWRRGGSSSAPRSGPGCAAM